MIGSTDPSTLKKIVYCNSMAIPGKYKVGKISSWEYLSGNLGKQMEPREGVGLYSSIKYWLVQVYDTQFHN